MDFSIFVWTHGTWCKVVFPKAQWVLFLACACLVFCSANHQCAAVCITGKQAAHCNFGVKIHHILRRPQPACSDQVGSTLRYYTHTCSVLFASLTGGGAPLQLSPK